MATKRPIFALNAREGKLVGSFSLSFSLSRLLSHLAPYLPLPLLLVSSQALTSHSEDPDEEADVSAGEHHILLKWVIFKVSVV